MIELKKGTASLVRRFLASDDGKEWIEALDSRIPSVVTGDAHNIILSAGLAEGYRRCLNDMIAIVQPPPPAEDKLENI